MTGRITVYAVLLIAGVAIGAIAHSAIDAPPTASSTTAPDAASAPALRRPASDDRDDIIDMLEGLSYALTQEAEHRQTLEDQIVALQKRVDDLQASVDKPADGRDVRVASIKQRTIARNQPLTVERLIEAGMDRRDAEQLKTRVDDLAMQNLYLRDQATREGWLNDKRFRQESQRIARERANLPNEFGDDAYDRYLYASGSPNRVKIQSVIRDSPAYAAGLRTGDTVVRYGDTRTYAPHLLRRATQSGQAGEMMALQVMRDGRLMDIYVPRGPLGITMTGSSEKP